MDTIDREIIAATQAGLPLTPHPYQFLAEQLNIDSHELMQRLRTMQDQGIIRRIAAVPNHYKLGYTHNGMTVWDINDALIDTLGTQIGQLDFVSHCYHRPRHLPDWPYNLFAMIHAKNPEMATEHIEHIRRLLGKHCQANEVLYSTKILKKTGLRIKHVPS